MENLTVLLSAWSHDGLSPALMTEVAFLCAALALAWLPAWSLGRHSKNESVLFGRQVIYIAQSWLQRQQPVLLFKIAIPVLLSLALIRLCARVLMAVFPRSGAAALTERLISWLAWAMAVLWITDLLPLVLQEMEQIHLNFGKVRLDLRTILEGVLSSGLVLMLSLWLSAVIEQRVLSQTVSDLSMRKVAANVLRAVLLLIGLLLALSAVGVDLTALSVLGGALGVGLGLGLQKLAANYVSGFVVLIERSVRIGDHIRVDGMEGQVTDIKTRYTLLRDTNGRESIIPNDMLITQRVDNFSLSDAAVALQTVVLVAVENDAAKVQAVLQEALGKVTDVLPEPPAQVFFSRFSADGLEMTLNFWVANQLHTRMAVLSRVNTAVWSALSAAGIQLPPPKAIANLSASTGDESR
ncbi:MAG: mechanosensitive ion channel [Burkholderiales bacterium]|nr:mechanosensitive ion channel [Burkholderiales bacterium]